MGKLTRITGDDGSVVTLSMIKWGALRRGAFGALKGITGQARPTQFVPQYEIAVYEGSTTLNFKPYVTFLYADEETALNGWDQLPNTIASFGLVGLQFMSRCLDPRKEAFMLP